jgi:hypothetical protein
MFASEIWSMALMENPIGESARAVTDLWRLQSKAKAFEMVVNNKKRSNFFIWAHS